MDAKYKFMNIRQGSEYVRINTEFISSVKKFRNGVDIYVVMSNGRSYIVGGNYAKKILELTKPK